MIKSSNQRNGILIILLAGFSLILWCYLFRLFLNGSAPLQGDAYPYLGHVRFYVENIMRGVYPFWDPLWDPIEQNYGNVNEFFLRRIGEFNPFFWTIVFLNKAGLPFIIAYRLFLAMYYFLGVAGFYLLSRRLFKDPLASFSAALLLLFSCIGASIFESYLLLEIVPFIWFFYFCVAFMQAPDKVFLLGVVFSLMIINITYIPFFFYIILFVFLACFCIVYAAKISAAYGQIKDFISRHQVFTCVCLVFVLASFVPGISWYKQTSQAEVSTMQRHSGSESGNSSTVSIDKINEGGIIPEVIFDAQFVNMDKIGLHNFYIPLFAFLMLFAGIWGRLNRRLTVFFIFGFIIFLIGLADASHIHQFLYTCLPLFKYFRNVQFFLQFAILPVFILFVVEQMRIFVEDCKHQPLADRKWMALWVIMVHICAAGLFWHNKAGCMTYAVIIFSLGWMLGNIWSKGSQQVWTLLLWGAIIFQPFEVYSHIAIDYPPSYQWGRDKEYILDLPSVPDAARITNFKEVPKKTVSHKSLPYFSTRWLYEAMGSIDNAVLRNYLNAPFILYDRIEPANDQTDPKHLQASLAHFEDLAFVYSDTMPKTEGFVLPQARIITSADKDFAVLKFDANDEIVRTVFTKPFFLVRTQNYHSQWKAFIDGKPAELLRTNICVQGLWVPAGDHVVHWHFGGPLRYIWAYFLVILYPLVLIWLIWLCFLYRASIKKSSI